MDFRECILGAGPSTRLFFLESIVIVAATVPKVSGHQALSQLGLDYGLFELRVHESSQPVHEVCHAESPDHQHVAQECCPWNRLVNYMCFQSVNQIYQHVNGSKDTSHKEVPFWETESVVHCVQAQQNKRPCMKVGVEDNQIHCDVLHV